METARLTGLQTFVHLVGSGLVPTEPNHGELCLDHAYVNERLAIMSWVIGDDALDGPG